MSNEVEDGSGSLAPFTVAFAVFRVDDEVDIRPLTRSLGVSSLGVDMRVLLAVERSAIAGVVELRSAPSPSSLRFCIIAES